MTGRSEVDAVKNIPVHPDLPRAILLLPNDGGLTMARTLRPMGVDIHALTDRRYAYVLASSAVQQGRVMPDIRRHPDVWLDELRRLADRGDTAVAGVLISGSDAATEFLTIHRDAIPATLRSFESGDGVHVALMNKRELYRHAADAGVRTPGSWDVATVPELDEALAQVTFPCILKPTMGHLAKAAVGVGTVRCEDPVSLTDAAGALLRHGLQMIVTELVPGPETALEGAVTIRTADGRYAMEYGRHKIRQWPPDYGTGSLLESVDVPEMFALNRRLLDHVGFVGLSSCEAKRHAITGELYLIEINVRMPANYGLSQACGVDGMWRLYATLAGLPLAPQHRPIPGRKVMMHPDLLAAYTQLRARPMSVGAVLRSWRGTRDFGVFHLRDPRPLAAMVRQELVELRGRRRRPPAAATTAAAVVVPPSTVVVPSSPVAGTVGDQEASGRTSRLG
jgi:predicted ATP-grasp superfamily ATP-dependent carboligase